MRILRERRLGPLLLGVGVAEGARDGDGGADDADAAHRVLEDDAGGDDDGNTLDGVGDGVGDGRHLVEREEGHLVVQVVVHAVDDDVLDQPRRADDGHRLGPGGGEAPPPCTRPPGA